VALKDENGLFRRASTVVERGGLATPPGSMAESTVLPRLIGRLDSGSFTGEPRRLGGSRSIQGHSRQSPQPAG
jgi:hypothetical protein